MGWRRVVQILGGFCIGVGVLSMCHNLSELASGLMGPSEELVKQDGLPAFMQDQGKVQYRALQSGVFRWYLGVQGAVDSVFAVLLVASGVGLLMRRPWARRVALVWGFYALAGACVYVVMVNRYLLPEALAMSEPSAPPGSGVVVAVVMLLVLWAFPAALVTLLMMSGARRVFAEPQTRADAAPPVDRPRAAWPSAASPTDTPAGGASAPEKASPDATPARHGPPADPPPGQQTWRDDPWNDPDAT